MNILVYPHQLVMGGSQINAIELAAKVRDRGHRVTVTAPDGLLASMIRQFDLEFVPTPVASYYPSPRTMVHLIRTARHINADLIHTYEWRPAVEASFGPHLVARIPMLMTVLSMHVPGFLPRHVPLLVGTQELEEEMRGRGMVDIFEPPIDAESNWCADNAAARARWAFRDDEVVVSIVCRMTSELHKLEGALEAIEAVRLLAGQYPLRLLVVGDGEGFEQIQRAVNSTNAYFDREVVIVTGSMLDPRDAYAAADIVIGMGSSSMKGMSFEKPLVVQGTHGYWRLLDEESVGIFLRQGMFGHYGNGVSDLKEILAGLAVDPIKRRRLGIFGRQLVLQRYSLESSADRLLSLYEQTLVQSVTEATWLKSMMRSAFEVTKFRTLMGLRASRDRLLARAAR